MRNIYSSSIFLFNQLERINKIKAAIPAITTKIIKKSYRFSILIPNKLGEGFPFSGYNPLSIPANLFAVADDKNHTPINKDAKRGGESLFTIDKPIGDKHNSPIVCKKYRPVSQSILDFAVSEMSFTPKAISR